MDMWLVRHGLPLFERILATLWGLFAGGAEDLNDVHRRTHGAL